MSALTEQFGAWAPYLALLLAGILPNEVWRWMAVAVSRGIDESSAVFEWVRLVSTCLVAGVVAQILSEPSGALAAVPELWRLGAAAAAVAGYFLSGRRVLTGVLAGVATTALAVAISG